MKKNLFLFISPHFDDAVLSCGGLINRLSKSGNEVKVVTVYTGDAPEDIPLSWLARRNHMAWDADRHPFKLRSIEDVKAMEILGIGYTHLNLLDAIYRRDLTGDYFYKKETVGVPVNTLDENRLLELLHAKFEEIMCQYEDYELRIFCPLSLGGHVDHVIVRRVVENFRNQATIIYYEDYPYAQSIGFTQELLKKDGLTWNSAKIALNESEIAARIAATACYSSQLRGLFPTLLERILEITQARFGFLNSFRFYHNLTTSRKRMEQSLRRYVSTVGGEQYWFRTDSEEWGRRFFSIEFSAE